MNIQICEKNLLFVTVCLFFCQKKKSFLKSKKLVNFWKKTKTRTTLLFISQKTKKAGKLFFVRCSFFFKVTSRVFTWYRYLQERFTTRRSEQCYIGGNLFFTCLVALPLYFFFFFAPVQVLKTNPINLKNEEKYAKLIFCPKICAEQFKILRDAKTSHNLYPRIENLIFFLKKVFIPNKKTLTGTKKVFQSKGTYFSKKKKKYSLK